MKKTYLKPKAVSVNVITDGIIAVSTSGDGVGSGGSRPSGGRGSAKEQQGDWDNIWSGGGSN